MTSSTGGAPSRPSRNSRSRSVPQGASSSTTGRRLTSRIVNVVRPIPQPSRSGSGRGRRERERRSGRDARTGGRARGRGPREVATCSKGEHRSLRHHVRDDGRPIGIRQRDLASAIPITPSGAGGAGRQVAPGFDQDARGYARLLEARRCRCSRSVAPGEVGATSAGTIPSVNAATCPAEVPIGSIGGIGHPESGGPALGRRRRTPVASGSDRLRPRLRTGPASRGDEMDGHDA